MAKSISAEELQLRKRARRRLIGAIALVTVVAGFLPMALEHEPRPFNQDISIRIPAPSSGAFTSKIVPVAPDTKSLAEPVSRTATEPRVSAKDAAPTVAAAAGTKPGEELPPPRADDVKKAQSKAQAKQTPTLPDKSVPAPGAAAVPDAADPVQPEARAAVAYVVQVAALNDAAKAKQIQDQIEAAGVKSYTEAVPTRKGNVTRVRAGPFATRDEAENVRDKLKGMGLNGNLVTQ